MMKLVNRSPLQVMLSVWMALFLRESLTRLFSRRAAWVWLLLEPVFHVGYLVFIFSAVRVHSVSGFDTSLWIVVGLLAFFMFDRTSSQVSSAVKANRALFSYRQVLPVDTMMVRALLEAAMLVVVGFLIFSAFALFGHSAWPNDWVAFVHPIVGLWLLALGWGFVRAVLHDLVPELEMVFDFVMKPMYLISGVMFPLSSVPLPYQDWLLYNPVAHGLEAARAGFSITYHTVSGLSIGYLYACTFALLFIGLLLMRRFATRLVAA